MNKQKTISIFSKKITKDRKVFYASTTKIGDEWYKVKFTKECNVRPDEAGYYNLTFDYNHCTIQRGEKYEKDGVEKTSNRTIWISECIKLVRDTEKEYQVLDEVFGDESVE